MAGDKHVITDAPENPRVQLRNRQMRYLVMMLLRVLCLVAAAVVVMADVPYALLWVGVCIVGMVLLPWMAVLIANDRPPRKKPSSNSLWRKTERLALGRSSTNNEPH